MAESERQPVADAHAKSQPDPQPIAVAQSTAFSTAFSNAHAVADGPADADPAADSEANPDPAAHAHVRAGAVSTQSSTRRLDHAEHPARRSRRTCATPPRRVTVRTSASISARAFADCVFSRRASCRSATNLQVRRLTSSRDYYMLRSMVR